jgi:integrating conjugative element membrane protein (TIGR03747 family)
VGRLLIGILSFGFWLVMGLIGNIALECVTVGWLWPQEGPKRSQAMLEAELAYLRQDFQGSLLVDDPAAFASRMALDLRKCLYQRTGIEAAIAKADQLSHNADEGPFKQQARQMIAGTRHYVQAAIIATEVYTIRIAVLILAMPIFFVLGLPALVEGLVERDLRRFGGGRERGQVYHLAKRGIAPALTLPWVIYLAWPVSVHPNWVILPFAGLFALALYVTTSSFKKYL